MNLLRAESILIERNNLTLEQVLGQGHFGCVYKGIMHSPDKDLDREVALKTLQSCELSLLQYNYRTTPHTPECRYRVRSTK